MILQFNRKAIINEATTRPTFCNRIVERSTTIVRIKVASDSKRDESIELVLPVSSNQPISFFKIAAAREITVVKKNMDTANSSQQSIRIFSDMLTCYKINWTKNIERKTLHKKESKKLIKKAVHQNYR